MAVPRWVQVSAPSSAGAANFANIGANQISSGVQGLTDAFNRYEQGTIDATASRSQANTDKAIASIIGAQSEQALQGLTGADGKLSKSALDKQFGSEYDPLQVAQAIGQRGTQFSAIDAEAKRLAGLQTQQDIVNTREDTRISNMEANRGTVNTLAERQRAEQERRNLVTEDQAQQRIDNQAQQAADKLAADGGTAERSGVNPATGKAFTGTQDKAFGFAGRAVDSTNRINELLASGYDAASLGNQLIPDNAAGNLVAANFSPQTQQYRQARNDWIAAVLRLESGAAIPESEQAKYERTYFPQAGDTQKTLDQKAEARLSQEKSLRKQAGRSDDVYDPYRPTTNAPTGAVEYLRANPDMADAFQSKYGYLPQ